jgi:hypothetical protein
MDWMAYGTNVLIAASSWFIGIVLARLVIRYFFSSRSDGPEMVGSGVTTDDVLAFDKSDIPFIPVKVSHEHGIYYAWFTNNDKFIGQAEKLDEIEMMAYKHLMKLVGLRMEFKQDGKEEATANE